MNLKIKLLKKDLKDLELLRELNSSLRYLVLIQLKVYVNF
nr:MAG TPA: hypothetical protein [Caudoviricetes sp.]